MPRYVKAIPSQFPRCRICHHPHAPDAFHRGSPDDWVPPGSDEEANQRAVETFVREFGVVSGSRNLVEFIAREERRARRETPGISLPDVVKRVAEAMRAAGLKGEGS